METKYSVKLSQVMEEFEMEKVYVPDDYEERLVTTSSINRPGMQLVGFFTHFSNDRLQIMGVVEIMYLKTLPANERKKCFEMLFKRDIPALIICQGMEIFPECLEMAEKYKVPLLRTDIDTSAFEAELIASLNNYLAPRITRHGVMVEVYGEGILMLGESGIGKSETAVELLKRGHRLIADDAVEIKKVSNKTLVGTSPEMIRHLIELRGIGIVDVRRLFGMGAVKESEKIDLVINLEKWDENTHYDRFGLDEQYTDILGLKISSLKILIRPGRNLAIIIEVAAMNNRLKRMGYNSAKELNKRLMAEYEANL